VFNRFRIYRETLSRFRAPLHRPPYTTATSFVPSADEATPNQFRLLACGVHVTPLSVDV
jgi:hypothetical protein